MGAYQSAWRQALSTMVSTRGQNGQLANGGAPTPKLTGLDALLIMGRFSTEIRSMIVNYNEYSTTVYANNGPTSNSMTPFEFAEATADGVYISVDDYLFKATTRPGYRKSQRFLPGNALLGGAPYGPFEPTLKWDTGYEIISSWQNLINQTSGFLQANPNAGISAIDTSVFCSTIDSICYQLDVNGTMPSTYWGTVAGAIRAEFSEAEKVTASAVVDASGLAGEVAAKAGDALGQGVGNFLGSFIENSGFTAIVVAALVGYLAVRWYL